MSGFTNDVMWIAYLIESMDSYMIQRQDRGDKIEGIRSRIRSRESIKVMREQERGWRRAGGRQQFISMLKYQKLVLFLISAAILAGPVGGRITFENDKQSTDVSIYDLNPLEEVLVEASYSYLDGSTFQDVYLVIKSSHSSKNTAFQELGKKYRGLVGSLIRIKAIPNEDSMIRSIVHKKYQKKSRKWEFSRYILVYSPQQEVSFILDQIRHFQPRTISKQPVMNYLNEKKMAIAAFTQAKNELEEFLKTQLNSEYKILQTKDIQIVGGGFTNDDYIEEDLQNNFNEQKSDERGAIWKDNHDRKRHYSQNSKSKDKKQNPQIQIKVLFQLVDRNTDMEELLEEINRGGEKTVEDFMSELDSEEDSEEWEGTSGEADL